MIRQSDKCQCGEVSKEELFRRLDECLERYKGMPGGLIPALHVAQGIFGHLPREVLMRISEALDIPMSKVYGVVSFYHFFTTEPRGKHTVRVCLGTACYVRGGKRVLDALRKKLGVEVGQTTADRNFTLEVARCFGACGLSPAVMINEEVFQRVKPSKIQQILDRFKEPAEAVLAAQPEEGT